MTTEAEILTQSQELLARVEAATSANEAIALAFTGYKDQLVALQQQLADAISSNVGQPSQSNQDALVEISNNLRKAIEGLDADQIAEKALLNTEVEPSVPEETTETPESE